MLACIYRDYAEIVGEIDPDRAFYDSTKAWRDRASSGTFHSGTLVDDPRSDARSEF